MQHCSRRARPSQYGTATGDCKSGLKLGKCGVSLVGNASSCVGKPSCVVSCSNSACTVDGKAVNTGDPCYQTKKKVDGKVTCDSAPGGGGKSAVTLTVKAHVPHTAVATTVIPLLGSTTYPHLAFAFFGNFGKLPRCPIYPNPKTKIPSRQ